MGTLLSGSVQYGSIRPPTFHLHCSVCGCGLIIGEDDVDLGPPWRWFVSGGHREPLCTGCKDWFVDKLILGVLDE